MTEQNTAINLAISVHCSRLTGYRTFDGDIIRAAADKQATIMISVDISAAFDTINFRVWFSRASTTSVLVVLHFVGRMQLVIRYISLAVRRRHAR